MCGRNPMRIIGGGLAICYISIGLTFMVVGFVLQVAPASSMMRYLQPYTNQLNVLFAPASAQFNPYNFIRALPQITGSIAVAFITMGIVQTIFGIVGMAALCSGRRRPVLTAFIVIMLLMIMWQMALIILYYALRTPIIKQAKAAMQQSIDEKYTGHSTTNMETILWNVFHVSFSCCGIDGGTDFNTAKNLPRNIVYNGVAYDSLVRPLTCCKPSNYTACLMTNHTNLAYSNHDHGCWNYIQNTADTNIVYAALGTGALILLEVVLLAFSTTVCHTGRLKADDEEEEQPVM